VLKLLGSPKFLATVLGANLAIFALASGQTEAAEAEAYRQLCSCTWIDPDTGKCGDYDDAGCDDEAPSTCGAFCWP
jgi:hypothetical protein